MAARPNFGSCARRSGWNARLAGVLLASTASLAAARPAKASRTQRKLAGYVMDDSTIRTAVVAWLSASSTASLEATYGHISTWETSGVTDMSYLFCVRQDWMEGGYDDCVSEASFNAVSYTHLTLPTKA